MASSSLIDRARIADLISDIGKAGLNALYPNEFEYYAVTLELTDSQGQTVDFLTFPISPDSIAYNHVPVTNIKKTMGGSVSLKSTSFVPRKITLSGTFGRKLRILIQPPITSPDSSNNGVFGADKEFKVSTSLFNSKIKTGYGTIKLLESIIEKSETLDSYGQPYRLFLYNPALGHNFLVENSGLDFNQDYQSSNMLWKYTLQLTAVSPLNAVLEDGGATSLTRNLQLNILQKSANVIGGAIKKAIL